MMKLYMPLHADLYTKDDWSDTSEEPEMLTGRALMEYEDSILIALIKNRMSEEAERGIMRWYGREDSVDRKVKSVVFTAEEREGQLWGVAECKVVGELTPEELDTLKDYISGQASDGWGEGFEQREIQVDDGELYVHLWNFGDWSIQTEGMLYAQARGGAAGAVFLHPSRHRCSHLHQTRRERLLPVRLEHRRQSQKRGHGR